MTLLLDLDGTLIDSSPTILQGFAMAMQSCGVEPIRPLTHDVIGPPLKDTLATLTGRTEPDVLESLASAFKSWYDTEGFKHTVVFPDVAESLSALSRQTRLYIATNKRLAPTQAILDYLGWTPWFSGIYALDKIHPAWANKGEMLAALMQAEGIQAHDALYVGDTLGDMKAAQANQLEFVAATWGYGDFSDIACKKLHRPHELMQLLNG
ncbi:HAD family hydrolase [Burkholderiaceae bacterium DAT-1]|nr:HAD family hydrolase [Burkholderiaceae bacterium DAT-1]